jgi:hypothetical protein
MNIGLKTQYLEKIFPEIGFNIPYTSLAVVPNQHDCTPFLGPL